MDQAQYELIQAEVDGELEPSQREAFEALLAADAEARDVHAALRRLDSMLGQVDPVEPPATLHGQIVNAIELPRPSFWSRFATVPAVMRYGLAATAAVLVTVGVYQTGGQLDGAQYDQLVGTIAARGTELDRFDFDTGTASGEVRLLQRKDTLALEFDFKTNGPLRFDVDFADSGLRFDAFTQADLNLDEISFTRTTLSAETTGDQRFMVLMRRDDQAAGASPHIDLTLTREGEVLGQGRLAPKAR